MSDLPLETQERIKKIENIKKAGLNPYPEKYERTHLTKEAFKKAETEGTRDTEEVMQSTKSEVKLAGRIVSFREHGKLIFAHLQDVSGKLQICFSKEVLGEEQYKFLKNSDVGDFLGAEGELFKTKHGEITLMVKNYQILAKSLRPLPEKWHGIQDQEIKYRQRYLDLVMNEETKERFILRSNILKALREFYWQEGFLEIETPVLENISSGATAKPFITHHNALDIDVYLRIAGGELWQKMAIGGGFEKTFEVARCFRNEGMDPSHLQEFTMIEHYSAYWNFEDNMNFTERMFEYLLKKLFGTTKIKIMDREGKAVEVDFKTPWPRKKFAELIEENCGIDILKTDQATELLQEIKTKKITIEDAANLGYGALVDALYKKVVRPKLIQPTFVIKHPVDMKPLARRSDENAKLCDTFQLLVNTWEVINAYSEIVDPIDQRKRFEVQASAKAKGDEEAMMMNEEFLTAMEHGFPPMSGWGMGIDRLCTLLTKQGNLRDCVLFPLMRPAEKTQSSKLKIQNDNLKSQNGNSGHGQMLNVKCQLSIVEAGITMEEARKMLNQYAKTPTFKLHCRETEVIMRALAKHFGDNEEAWGIAGLLHDLDWEIPGIQEQPEQHGIKSAEILQNTTINPAIIHSIQAHNAEYTGIQRKSRLDFALSSAETITGLIFATALIYPDKKLASVKVESVLKRMKKKDFARNCSRERIHECEKIGIPLEKFVEIALTAMQGISGELGL